MRKSLALHARERMRRNEDAARALRHWQLAQAEALVNSLWTASAYVTQTQPATSPPATSPPELTALRQRAGRAERNAASWRRLAIMSAVACVLLLVFR